jgi:hypothetical protein
MQWALVSTSLLTLSGRGLASNACPFLGPAYPPPKNLLSDSTWKTFAAGLAANMSNYVRAGSSPYGPLSTNDTSFSIHIVSPDSAQPLFDFHHTAPIRDNITIGTSKVDADTVYRIGSISKLITTYALMLNGGVDSFNDPVTKYLPQLGKYRQGSDLDQVHWDEITLGALATHMAGVPRECAYSA